MLESYVVRLQAALTTLASCVALLACSDAAQSTAEPRPSPPQAGAAPSQTVAASPADGGSATNPGESQPPQVEQAPTSPPTDCTVVRCHYVRAGATGTHDGTDWDNAFASLPKALVRGDTYFIADGDYPGYTFGTATAGSQLITVKKAIAADHGTDHGWLIAYGDGQATFGAMLEFTSSFWILDGQTGGGAANGWNQHLGFKVNEPIDSNTLLRIAYTGTADNVTIRHIELQGKGSVSNQGGGYSNDGLAVYGAKDVTLSYFWMHGIGRCPVFPSATNLVVEHGWVESYFGSSAVHSEIASIWSFDGPIGDMTFRYNLFTAIRSTGGLMWDNSESPNAHLYVYGNVFYKRPGDTWEQANGVIGGWTGGHGEVCRNVLVYNNTFINVDQQTLSTFPNVASGNAAYNNVFYNCDSPDFSKFETHDYNTFWNSGDAHGEAHGVSGTPGAFEDLAKLDFRLKSPTSAGKAFPNPFDRDPLLRARGADGTWDRGAFEFQSSGN